MATVADATVHFDEMRVMPDRLPHKLRADAQENRDRVLAAARELFAKRGLDVTMRAIARAAGVGPATLYRRFPTRRALLDAAFADELHACAGIVDAGCADPDPWHGLCSVIEGLIVLNAQNQGFVDAFLSAGPEIDTVVAHRAALLPRLVDLTARARDAGSLRSDVGIDDVVLVLLAGRGLSAVSPDDRTAAARRLSALAIDGLRVSGANGPLPRATRLATRLVRSAGTSRM